MEVLFYALAVIIGLILLFLIFKFLGSCIIRLLLGLVVIAAIVAIIFFLVRC